MFYSTCHPEFFNWKIIFPSFSQDATKENKAALLSPDEGEEAESPMPSNIQQPVRRRGAISAEPINEEDAATYVKKVVFFV